MYDTKTTSADSKDAYLPAKLRILTVGDGDFSASLALLRAYPSLIQHLVATSLLSQTQVIETYPHALGIIEKLGELENVEIIYGVDATQLHLHKDWIGRFDVVMFHHPHLGCDEVAPYENAQQENDANNLQSTEARDNNNLAKQHECLITHYLYSASILLNMNNNTNKATPNIILPCIHLCLCASSIDNWNILQSVTEQGLQFAWGSPTAASSPPFEYYEQILNSQSDSILCESKMRSLQNMEKRLRECKHAKRRGHWLGRYGYRHQPTFPNSTEFGNASVSNSFHFFLTKRSGNVPLCIRCRVCGEEFQY